MLKTIKSGGQTGADVAGLEVGRIRGLNTGGFIPNGCRTLEGPRPDLKEKYGLEETLSPSYVPRTRMNVYHSDGTIRIAGNFRSPGERCTLKAIQESGKPYIDVRVGEIKEEDVLRVVGWIKKHRIKTLNVAGNAESTFKGTYDFTVRFLNLVIDELNEASSSEITETDF